MAKGNMFVQTAKGRVGNLVLYTRSGEQITRAYQGDVKNPKTTAQMLQRAKFANAVKFYQKAVQHFFKFAYQDKKSNETDFNAFMRHNTNVASLLRKDEVQDAYFPAIGRWVMASGSLSQAFIPTFVDGAVRFNNTAIVNEDVLSSAEHISIYLSNLLLGQGFQYGDIITLVIISSLVTSLDFDLSNYYDSGNLQQPQWLIAQFIVNPNEDTLAMSGNTDILGEDMSGNGYVGYKFKHPDYSIGAACIVTRKVDNKMYASNAELVPNAALLAMINAAKTDNWKSEVTASWQATGEAILQGSIATRSGSTGGTAGTGSSSGSSTGGTTLTSQIETINGSRTGYVRITGSGTVAMTIGGVQLSSIKPVATGEGITITEFKVNDTKESATFNIVVAESFGSGSVSYMGKTVAQVTADNGNNF